jgi:hypothetical protein
MRAGQREKGLAADLGKPGQTWACRTRRRAKGAGGTIGSAGMDKMRLNGKILAVKFSGVDFWTPDKAQFRNFKK